MSLKPSDSEIQNGDRFCYRTANTDVLGWLLEEKTEYGVTEYLSKKIWSKLGVAFDAACHVDDTGLPYVGGGLTTTLQDLALFGEMIRNYGRNMKGEQIFPPEIIKDIKNNGNITQFGSSALKLTCAIGGPAEFCREFPKEARVNSYLRTIGKPDGLPGWAYKDQFWTIPGNIVTQIGIRGQYNWVDFNADIVITKFSSKPTESERIDDEYRAFLKIGEYFINKEIKQPKTRTSKKGKATRKSRK